MTKIRGVVDMRRDTITPESMEPEVDHFSIPALDAGGRPETTASDEIDSQKLLLRGGEVLTSRLNPRKSRVHIVPEELPRQAVASTEFVALRPVGIDRSYLAYLLQSERTRQDLDGLTRSATRSHKRVERIEILNIEVPISRAEEQRRIAEFLDDRVARIDQIIAGRQQQVAGLSEGGTRLSYEAIRGQHEYDRRESGLAWLGDIPRDWPVLSVGSQFQVDLGKMLDEKRQSGVGRIPYLRNTNVQWDVVNTDDLKQMDIADDERQRFTVRGGDLLICEGGQPGRSAIWRGGIEPLGYQKALHRARSRGRSVPEWLLECLRTAVALEVFSIGSGQTTIAHLPNDQLRSTKFPFPEPHEQREVLDQLQTRRDSLGSLQAACQRQIERFQEYKQSLITAAVTGEFDVTTASTKIPE